MRMRSVIVAFLLAAAPAAWAQEECVGDKYGTAVSWIKETAKAAELARAEKKLVMVMHLSGELDDPQKT